MAERKIDRKAIVALIAIMLLQIAMHIWVGAQKTGYHIDESFSYMLANSHDYPLISWNRDVWENWCSGSDFLEFMTVQEGEGFDYGTVYYNQTMDVHPPLFYWLLHTISSMHPDSFSKWYGFALNTPFMLGTTLFIYLIARKLFGDERWRICAAAFWAFSHMALDVAGFIRMYMMATFFFTAFVYIVLNILEKGVSAKRLAPLGIVIYLGSMTHYYFIVAAGIGSVILLIPILRKREYKKAIAYSAVALGAVALFCISFPYVFRHLFWSETNVVGTNLRKHAFDLLGWVNVTFIMTFDLASHTLAHGLVSLIAVSAGTLAFVIYYCFFYSRKASEEDKAWKRNAAFRYCGWTFLISFVAITFISGLYPYIRYLYPIMPIGSLVILYIAKSTVLRKAKADRIAPTCIAVLSSINMILSVAMGTQYYLQHEQADVIAMLEEYHDTPLIIAAESVETLYATIPEFLPLLSDFDRIYIDHRDDIGADNIINEALDDYGACVIYAIPNVFEGDPDYPLDGVESAEHICDLLGAEFRIIRR